MKTIKILVTKETISKTFYGSNSDCAICRTLRNLGYEIKSAGGSWVRGLDDEKYYFINETGIKLRDEFTKKDSGQPYSDVICEFNSLPERTIVIQEPKEKIVYKTVLIDEAVKTLQTSLTEN